jgi:signal transduction histidine kinase
MTFSVPEIRRDVSRTYVLVVSVSVLALGVLVLVMGLVLRDHLRQQILSRDALLIEAVVSLVSEAESLLTEFDLLGGALDASELRGVLGLVVTDLEGTVLAEVPDDLLGASIPVADRERVQAEGAYARFHESVPLGILFDELVLESEEVPMVEVVVPVRDGEGTLRLLARFWTDGTVVAREFATLDRNLVLQGLVAWLAAALAVAGVFAYALGRLRTSAEALAARTRELEEMNRELELAARTAAIGSISAHLLHGLKSPLAGLRAYLRAHGDEEALAAAQRMQQLVQETLRVLREETREGRHAVPLETVVEELRSKLAPRLADGRCQLEAPALPEVELPRRQANLLGLVLENLAANAFEATAGPTVVRLSATMRARTLVLEVADESGGVPDALRARLFTPGVSSKSGGSGLGLAISRQLLVSLHGDLALAASDSRGTRFRIELPVVVPASTTPGKRG